MSREESPKAPSEERPPIKYTRPSINFALKAKYSAYTTLIFFLVANPETYKILQKYLGSWIDIASQGGCPTPTGFFLHTGLFFVILWSFMLFPRD